MGIINRYNQIIDILMKNDSNASWDQIMNDMKYNYQGDDIVKYSILELIEALETALEDSDEEIKDFYKQQYIKAKILKKGIE